jgi:membrane protein YqaA with SNARE-associated domain
MIRRVMSHDDFPIPVSPDWGGGSAALDSSRLFLPPFDVESAIVILRRHAEMVWLLPFLATAGSLIAAAMVFWIGRKIGNNGLEHWISPRMLESVRRKVRYKGAIALVLPALCPHLSRSCLLSWPAERCR